MMVFLNFKNLLRNCALLLWLPLIYVLSLWCVLGTPDKHVAFQVTTTDDIPANGGVIVFDQVNTNLGQGYNSTSGIFTIWRDGVYIFTWSMRSHPVTRKYTDTYLFVNGEAVGNLRDKSENLVTNSAMFHLKSRDQVYICSRYTTPYVGAMSQFSGWLQSPGM